MLEKSLFNLESYATNDFERSLIEVCRGLKYPAGVVYHNVLHLITGVLPKGLVLLLPSSRVNPNSFSLCLGESGSGKTELIDPFIDVLFENSRSLVMRADELTLKRCVIKSAQGLLLYRPSIGSLIEGLDTQESLRFLKRVWDGSEFGAKSKRAYAYQVSLVTESSLERLKAIVPVADPEKLLSRFSFAHLSNEPFRSGINTELSLTRLAKNFSQILSRIMYDFSAETELRLTGTAQARMQAFSDSCQGMAEVYKAEHPGYSYWLRHLAIKVTKIAIAMHVLDVATDAVHHTRLLNEATIDKAIAWGLWQIEEAKQVYEIEETNVPCDRLLAFQKMLKACKGHKVLYREVRTHGVFRAVKTKTLYCSDPQKIATSTRGLNKSEVYSMWREMAEYGLAYFDPAEGSLTPIVRK